MSKIKDHFVNHKELYIGIGIGAVVAVAGTCAYLALNPKAAGIVQNTVVIGMNNRVNPTIVNFIERSTPSKPVHIVGTDSYFDSLHEAARKTGHSVARISKNVNGKIPSVNGDVFELLNVA